MKIKFVFGNKTPEYISEMKPVIETFLMRARFPHPIMYNAGRHWKTPHVVEFYRYENFTLRNAHRRNIVIFVDCFMEGDQFDNLRKHSYIYFLLTRNFQKRKQFEKEFGALDFMQLNETNRYFSKENLKIFDSQSDYLMKVLAQVWGAVNSPYDRMIIEEIDEYEKGKRESISSRFRNFY